MKKWERDASRDLYKNGNRIVTHEQWENLRGKYTIPTDELLDAIFEIINL